MQLIIIVMSVIFTQGNRIEVSVDEYEHFFKRFDQLELNHELEKSNADRDIFYLKSIDNNIREYHIAE